jgi:hypothetical protein
MVTTKRRALLLLMPVAVVSSLTLPAIGGSTHNPHPSRPPSVMRFAHARDARVVAARSEGQAVDADEAQEVWAGTEWMNSISSAPAETVSARALLAGSRHAEAMPATSGRWTEVTARPFLDDPVKRGANYGVGWHWISGRMTALTSTGGTIFAGAAAGGVWRSTDMGKHWTPVNSGLPGLAVGALVTNPHDGSVWVGLGEANTNFDAQTALGIYRLALGSSHWQRVGGKETLSRAVYNLRFIHGWAYAATQQGLLRRPANNVSSPWQVALKPDPNPTHSPYRTSHVTDVVAVPGTGGRQVLAALGWRGGSIPSDLTYNGFYVSKSGGAPHSFRRITVKGAINPKTIGRTTFSASGRRIYAVVEDSSTVSLLGQGAYVSPTGNPAGPWRRIATPYKLATQADSALATPPDYFPGVQAWYNQYIKADPADPKHVYLGLEEIYESTNGGRTWSTIGPYWNYGISCNKTGNTPYACPPTTHPDQHAITFKGNDVFVGSDGGLWRRSINRHTRGGWVNLNKTLHTLQYYSAQVGRTGGGLAYWGGMQDNGESIKLPYLRELQQAFTGDGGDTIVDPAHGGRAVVEGTYLDMYTTTDAGRQLREISPSCLINSPIANCDPSPQFIAPIEADDKDINHWAAGGQFVWTTTRGWATVCAAGVRCDWTKQYDQGAGRNTTAVDISGDTIYAPWCGPCNPASGAPFDRGISTNAGGSWHQLDLSGLPNRFITSVYIDPDNAMHATITFGAYSRRWIDGAGYGHLWRTTDGGHTWRDISGGLPDVPAHDVLQFAGGWAVATDVGVFWRKPGLGWTQLGGNLPQTRVWDLALTPRGDTLVAATHGRGQWSIHQP